MTTDDKLDMVLIDINAIRVSLAVGLEQGISSRKRLAKIESFNAETEDRLQELELSSMASGKMLKGYTTFAWGVITAALAAMFYYVAEHI